MADKTITFSKSIVAQKKFIDGNASAYITQLSEPIILKGVSTKTCENVLYSIDGIHFTEETNIRDDHVLSMAIVPFQLGGEAIGSPADINTGEAAASLFYKACSYILGGRDINEDINIDNPISKVKPSSSVVVGNGAYRYLLQHLAKKNEGGDIAWDTGDLFSELDADEQDSFGGSDFITDNISVKYSESAQQLSISSQTDASGLILKPAIELGDVLGNTIIIKQAPHFFLYPEGCPAPDGDPEALIIDNFWRGGGLLVSNKYSIEHRTILTLYIFAVT